MRSQIEDAMLRLSKELQAYVTVGFSYSLLGGGLQMLEADEVLARLEKLVTWTSNTLQSPMPTQSVACAIMIFQLGIQGRQTELCTTGGGGGASRITIGSGVSARSRSCLIMSGGASGGLMFGSFFFFLLKITIIRRYN